MTIMIKAFFTGMRRILPHKQTYGQIIYLKNGMWHYVNMQGRAQ